MKTFKIIAAFSFVAIALTLSLGFWTQKEKNEPQPVDHVTIAILAKDKAHTLPLYLSCLEKQTFPKDKTYLYIRTNNNNDDTVAILQEWVKKVGNSYAGVFFDDKDVQEAVQNYKQHEWNAIRFKVLGKIRQDSLDFAEKNNSHYFVADCDNFIQPQTVQKLVDTNLPIVAPLLKVADTGLYSNYHAAVDANGYFANSPHYMDILSQNIKGLVELPVVHCSYFIRHDVLNKMSYDDNSYRYEYVIFSDNARKQNIPQYLDNREVYGRITFAENAEQFQKEHWLAEFQTPEEKVMTAFTNIYRNGIWGKNSEGNGCSGTGSTAENTEKYREFLQRFLKDSKVKSVVDIGCGDWEFSKLMDWKGIAYKGYDVVKDVIQRNNENYSSSQVQFFHENFLNAELPKADVLICKDVFQHLSNEQILSFLPKLKNYKYVFITNDVHPYTKTSENLNIEAGDYRFLDLTKAPFNLKAEKALDYAAGYHHKQVLVLHND